MNKTKIKTIVIICLILFSIFLMFRLIQFAIVLDYMSTEVVELTCFTKDGNLRAYINIDQNVTINQTNVWRDDRARTPYKFDKDNYHTCIIKRYFEEEK